MITYTSPEQAHPPLLLLALPRDAAHARFVLLGSSSSPAFIVKVDEIFPVLLGKIAKYVTKAQKSACGTEFELVEFMVRVGIVFGKVSPVAEVLEVEFRPYAVLFRCMREEMVARQCAPLLVSGDAGAKTVAVAKRSCSYTRVSLEFGNFMMRQEARVFSGRHLVLL